MSIYINSERNIRRCEYGIYKIFIHRDGDAFIDWLL
jgi:hypothetical protein